MRTIHAPRRPLPRPLPVVGALLLALCLNPFPLMAQAVSGILRAEGARTPIEGAVVSLLDSRGAARSATLTDRAGRFRLPAPSPGQYRLRAERVGFRSTLSPALALHPGGTVTHDLLASVMAVELGGIEVSAADRRCVVRPREGVETATLWDEARKALTAAALTEEQSLVRFTTRRYQRELDRQSLMVRREQTASSSGFGERPFLSRPAAELAELGYVRMEGESRVYYAPDAQVLLSDEFLDTHCFRIETDGEPGLVGLGFRPVRDRRIPDIEGVLWLNARTSELRFVEFNYTGVQLPEPAANGGRVEYERLPTGAWIVRRWWIRMAQITREAGTGRLSVGGVRETGGEVVELTVGAGTRLTDAGGGTVTGSVFDSIAGAPLAGASVYLNGTSYSAQTGPDGAFRIERVPEGSYAVGFLHPRLESLGMILPPQPVTLPRGGEARAELAIPSLTTALAISCRDDPRGRESGVLVGVVRDPRTGVSLPNARVTLRYSPPGQAPRQLVATADSEGKYRFCATPIGAVEVRAELLQRRGQRMTASLSRGEPTRLDLALAMAAGPPPEGAERVVGDGAAATLIGQVLDAETDDPVVGARVRLTNREGRAVTDQKGEFRFSGPIAGPQVLAIDHSGYESQTAVVELASGANRADIRLPRTVVELEGIQVTVRPDAAGLTRSTARHVFSGPELRQMNNRGVRMVEMLQTRFAVRVKHLYPPTAGICVEYGRGTGMTSAHNPQASTGPDCNMIELYIDGVRTNDPGLILRGMSLDTVESVEMLPAIEAGIRYGTRGVGVLLITTRKH